MKSDWSYAFSLITNDKLYKSNYSYSCLVSYTDKMLMLLKIKQLKN